MLAAMCAFIAIGIAGGGRRADAGVIAVAVLLALAYLIVPGLM